MAERERLFREKELREKASKDRKLRMKELEKKAIQMAKKSDAEIEQMAKDQALREAAAEKLDTNSDTVKLLSSIACKAIAYSLRDQQIQEKHHREQIEAEYNRRMDIIMEIDRLKDLQRREDEEVAKRKKRIEDRKVINEQIAERQRQRMLEIEAKEQENLQMRNLMGKYEEEDRILAEKRKVEVERSRLEVLRANEDAIRRKREGKAAEKKEMEDILIYQAMQDAKLRAREEEEAALEHAKKERQAKLLAQQERAQNNAGKLDELRARRAAEERERRERSREKADALKKRNDMQDLLRSRAQQAADRKARDERMQYVQQEEYKNALLYMQKMAEREEAERLAKIEKSIEHRNGIMNQIKNNELRRTLAQSGKFDEGASFRQANLAEETRLKVIRDKMVSELEAKGVGAKYLAEMKNLDIGKLLRV